MRCLVTGATGFVGRHLVTELRAAGHEVFGLARRADPLLFSVDLVDANACAAVLEQVRPEWVFHLAGYANTGKSVREPDAAWAGNLTATRSLYQAITQSNLRPRILFVSTGLIYGEAQPGETFWTEETPLRPMSPYAASKAAADLLSFQQAASGALDIVRVRPFNQLGPGQSSEYAAANFARQIAAVERGELPPVVVTGDLTGERDLTDVRDMVRAYIRLLESAPSGEVYNAGSGTTYVMRDLLAKLAAHSRVPVRVEELVDPARRGDRTVGRADTRKLRKATGWQPMIRLEQTLEDMLTEWRNHPSPND
jgi:GDP-4-dehydro-6-deoxy-D-mannose reductase